MTKFLIKLFLKTPYDPSDNKLRENYGKFAGLVGIGSNLVLVAIKLAIGLLANSIAIIADAVNNFTDSASSLITFLGFKIAGKPADIEHPYGHERMEYLAGLVVSIIIIFLGLQLGWTSIQKIIHPEVTKFSLITIIILILSIFIKLWQSLFYKKIGDLIDSTTLLATSVDSRNDIIATGSVLLAVVLNEITGLNIDGYMGVVVSLFIIYSGISLVMETSDPLLGIAPTAELINDITDKINGYEGIIGIHDLVVHNYGVSKTFASVHCEVAAEDDIMISHDIIDNIERDFLDNMAINMVIHLDPVVTNDEKTNKLKAQVEEIITNISPEIDMHDFRVVWGVSHSNIIFDVAIHYDSIWTEDELKKIITNKIKKIDPKFNTVITIDYSLLPK